MVATDMADWWGAGAIASYFASKAPNERLVQWLDDHSMPFPTSVLDIGCGHGRNLTIFQETPFISGFDPSPGSVCFASTRTDIARHASIKAGRLPNHPYKGNRFDLVIADGVLHQVTNERDWVHALLAICEAVEIGGTLFLSLFVSDNSPGKCQSSDGLLWTSHEHPPMRLLHSTEVIAHLVSAGGIVKRSLLEQFDLPSGSRANLTLLLGFE